MKKKILIGLLLIAGVFAAGARTITAVKEVHGNVSHSLQAAWVLVDETTSAGTEPTAGPPRC